MGRNCAWSPWQPGSYRSCEASQHSCCEPGGRGCAPRAESLHPDTDISRENKREGATYSTHILQLCIIFSFHKKSPNFYKCKLMQIYLAQDTT